MASEASEPEPCEAPIVSAVTHLLRWRNKQPLWDSKERNGWPSKQNQKSSIRGQKTKNDFKFSQGIWHQTKEDMVVPGNCCHGNRSYFGALTWLFIGGKC